MAPPTSDPGSPYREEEPYMNKLLRAIELAINEVINEQTREITRLEQEKLCYFAVIEFDLPITYSWYLAGAYTKVTGEPNDAPGRMTVDTQGLSQDPGESEDVRVYRDYFATEEFCKDYNLKKIWYTDRFEFLRDFYGECAPSEYTNLYIASTDIREQLLHLDDTLERETRNSSLSEFGGGSDEGVLTHVDEKEFRLSVSDLHLELAQIYDFSEIVEPITRGTDVLEQVFAQLTKLDSISRDQEVVLDDLAAFFYYTVWMYPALYISVQTAEGPNRHHLIEEHATRFEKFHEQLLSHQTQLRERCIGAGLYPEAGHHSQKVDEEQIAHLHEMAKEVIESVK